MASETLLTADWLIEQRDLRAELVRGRLLPMTPPPGEEHGRLTFRLGLSVGSWVSRQKLGEVYAAETGFLLESDPDTVRAADLALVSRERIDALGLRPSPKYWQCGPDLVAEVLSPSDRWSDVETKAAQWLAAGTRVVLLIDPATKSVRVRRPDGSSVAVTGDALLEVPDVLPGWSMELAELFADLFAD